MLESRKGNRFTCSVWFVFLYSINTSIWRRFWGVWNSKILCLTWHQSRIRSLIEPYRTCFPVGCEAKYLRAPTGHAPADDYVVNEVHAQVPGCRMHDDVIRWCFHYFVLPLLCVALPYFALIGFVLPLPCFALDFTFALPCPWLCLFLCLALPLPLPSNLTCLPLP